MFRGLKPSLLFSLFLAVALGWVLTEGFAEFGTGFDATSGRAPDEGVTDGGASSAGVHSVAPSAQVVSSGGSRQIPTSHDAPLRDADLPEAANGSQDAPFDFEAIVERAHFSYRPGSDPADGLRGGHATYEVAVRQGGLDFEVRPPGAGVESGDSSSVERLRIETIALGRGAPRAVREGAARVGSDGHAELDRGDHIEHFRNGRDGVEQSWEFADRPEGRGDLVLHVSAEGLPFTARTDGGLHFANADGVGARYGHGTWVDASGASHRVPALWRGGLIELRVPGDVVDSARYPALLDPVVGPEFGLDMPVEVPGVAVTSISTAFNGSHHLVAWADPSSGLSQVYVTIVDSFGVVILPTPLMLSDPDGTGGGNPTVASDGTHFLVAWERFGSIRGTLFTSDGSVVGSDGFPVMGAFGGMWEPSAASNGSSFLVAARTGGTGAFGGPTSKVRYRRLNLDGSQDGPAADLYAFDDGNQRHPQVSSNGGDYFVASVNAQVPGDAGPGGYRIMGTRVTGAGSVLDPDGLLVSGSSLPTDSSATVSIASDGTDYMAAWHDHGSVYRARVLADGSLPDDPAVDGPLSSDGSGAGIASTGGEYFLAWKSAAEAQLYGTRLAADGTPLDPAGVPLGVGASPGCGDPHVASAASGQFVTWWCGYSVEATRIDADGLATDVPPLLLHENLVLNEEFAPSVAASDTQYLVTWRDSRGPSSSGIYGVRVSATGVVLDPVAIPLSPADEYASTSAVASDGAGFFVSWRIGSSGIRGARVDEAGTVLDPDGMDVSASGVDPHVASNGSSFLVVWLDAYDIVGSRVALDGSLLDVSPLLLDPADWRGVWLVEELDFFFDVASNGSNYAVVFTKVVDAVIDGCIGPAWDAVCWGDSTLSARLRIVNADGSLPAADATRLSQAGSSANVFPSISADGSDYVATWSDGWPSGAPETQVIQGRRLAEDGSLVGDVRTFSNSLHADRQDVSCDGVGCYVGIRSVVTGDNTLVGLRVAADGSDLPVDAFPISDGHDPASLEEHPVSTPALASLSPLSTLIVYQRNVDGSPRARARLLSLFEAPEGTSCLLDDQCGSGYCVDGFCCMTDCGGGAEDDCLSCAGAENGIGDGICGAIAAGTACGDPGSNDCSGSDSCDGAGVCSANDAPPGTACGDPSVRECDDADTCNGAGGCLGNRFPEGAACDDGLFCTAGDSCVAGFCVSGAAPACGAEDKCDDDVDACYPACGDGVLDAGEACDEGLANSDAPDATCRTGCVLAACGDGVVDSDEECDQGSEGSLDCTPSCSLVAPADGTIAPPADEPGCGCAVPGSSSRGSELPPLGAAMALALLALARLRRRRGLVVDGR